MDQNGICVYLWQLLGGYIPNLLLWSSFQARAWGLLFNPAFRGTRVPFEFKLDKTHSKHMYFRRGGIHSNQTCLNLSLSFKKSTHSHTYMICICPISGAFALCIPSFSFEGINKRPGHEPNKHFLRSVLFILRAVFFFSHFHWSWYILVIFVAFQTVGRMPFGLGSSSAEAHQSGLAALALNQSGSLVATASETGTVREPRARHHNGPWWYSTFFWVCVCGGARWKHQR